jgi:hypothetical protein
MAGKKIVKKYVVWISPEFFGGVSMEINFTQIRPFALAFRRSSTNS